MPNLYQTQSFCRCMQVFVTREIFFTDGPIGPLAEPGEMLVQRACEFKTPLRPTAVITGIVLPQERQRGILDLLHVPGVELPDPASCLGHRPGLTRLTHPDHVAQAHAAIEVFEE